jgi:hypothetical protein
MAMKVLPVIENTKRKERYDVSIIESLKRRRNTEEMLSKQKYYAAP